MPSRTVDFCREQDLPELFARFAEWYRFNPRLRERAYFDWQFRDAPTRLGDGEYDFLLLKDGADAITGCLGFTGFECRIGGEIRTAGWTHNWMAEDRGDGGLALLACFMELTDHRFLLRLNEKSGAVMKLLRVPMLPAMPRWWAVIDEEQVATLFSFARASDRAVLSRSASAFRSAASRGQVSRPQRFAADEEFDADYLGEMAGGARRTGRYLNWRYCDIPNHDYRLLQSRRAFGVYRVETVMGTEAEVIRVLEWTFGASETEAALATILADCRLQNPILIDFHSTFDPLAVILGQAGFVPQGSTAVPMPDLFRPTFHSGGYAVAIDLPPHRQPRSVEFGRWYITAGDSDLDRVKL